MSRLPVTGHPAPVTSVWQTSRRKIVIGSRPLVMGIVNVTPDSFSDGGQFFSTHAAVDHAKRLIDEGADLLDIGGESTRPGATPVDADEESGRVRPVLEKISGLGVPISIDTTKAVVAARALEAGAEIINDVSGGYWDPALWSVVAQHRAGYVLMHCQGTPATMQQNPHYTDVVVEVKTHLSQRLAEALAAGLTAEHIVVDVGLGFGKTVEHNLALLRELNTFTSLHRPLLIGASRKSFLKKIGGEAHFSVSTLTAHVWAATQGARIWRVHDVAEARTASRVMEKLCLE